MDENEAFISASKPQYISTKQTAYDDDDDDDVNKPIYSSAPDPAIASSAVEINTTEINNNGISDDEDEGFGHSTYGQRMDYTTSEYQDKFFMFLWIFHFIIMFIVLIYQWSDTKIVIKEANAGFLVVFVCSVIGVILGYIWTKIMRKYAGK
eukprot:1007326_1